MQTVKRLGVLSVALVSAVGYAIIGFLIGIFIALFGKTLLLAQQTLQTQTGAEWMLTIGPLAIIVAPLFYAIIGFVAGAIGALLYNLVAKITGGVKLELIGQAAKK